MNADPTGLHKESGKEPDPIPMASGSPSQGARSRAFRTVVAGAVLTGIGLIVTVATYAAAASNPRGGSYFVAFGPIIFGIVLMVRGWRELDRQRSRVPATTMVAERGTPFLGTLPAEEIRSQESGHSQEG